MNPRFPSHWAAVARLSACLGGNMRMCKNNQMIA